MSHNFQVWEVQDQGAGFAKAMSPQDKRHYIAEGQRQGMGMGELGMREKKKMSSLTQKIPHRHSQKYVSHIFLSPVKLKVKTNHHTEFQRAW